MNDARSLLACQWLLPCTQPRGVETRRASTVSGLRPIARPNSAHHSCVFVPYSVLAIVNANLSLFNNHQWLLVCCNFASKPCPRNLEPIKQPPRACAIGHTISVAKKKEIPRTENDRARCHGRKSKTKGFYSYMTSTVAMFFQDFAPSGSSQHSRLIFTVLCDVNVNKVILYVSCA